MDEHWRQTLRGRERAVACQHLKVSERQGAPRPLTGLSPCTQVWIQNQATHVCDRRGMVKEALPYRQYTIKLEDSGRVSLHNRRHLRPVRAGDTPPQPPHGRQVSPSKTLPQCLGPPSESVQMSQRLERHLRRSRWLSDFITDTPT